MRTSIVAAVVLLSMAAARAERLPVKDVLADMQGAWNNTDSYTCRMDVWTKRGGDEKVQAFDFMFKKPRFIKLKVQAGSHRGADVLYRDGKIRAAERVLGIRVKKGMSPKDSEFYSLRGVPFWEADMGSQIEHIRSLLPRVESSAERVHQDGEVFYLVTLRWRGEDANVNTGVHNYVRTWKLDGHSFFPLERTATEDGVKVEDVRASSLNLHPNLTEDAFRL